MADVTLKRLKSRSQFQAVLGGQTVSKTSHFAMHCKAVDITLPGELHPLFTPGVWLGAMVPKRWAKRAVTRNSIKRQIYAIGMGLNLCSPSAAYVVRLRQEFSRKNFPSASSVTLQEAVRAELIDLMRRGLKEN